MNFTEDDLQEMEWWAARNAQKYGAVDLRGTLAQWVLILVAEVRRLQEELKQTLERGEATSRPG